MDAHLDWRDVVPSHDHTGEVLQRVGEKLPGYSFTATVCVGKYLKLGLVTFYII